MEGPNATGFFVARCSASLTGMYHIYAVSNRHAVNPSSCIRVNTQEGTTRLIDLEPIEWELSDTEDLAVSDVTDHFNFDADTFDWSHEISWVQEENFLTPNYVYSDNVGVGDQTVMMGLFADHGGSDKNVPVARFGNIAAMPDASAPVSLHRGDHYRRPAYLNDSRSRGGFSGSPIWVWRTPGDEMGLWEGAGIVRERMPPEHRAFLLLAGIHRGQFRENTMILASESARVLKSGDEIEIASAMTVVIPAWEISGMMDHAKFQAQRDIRDQRIDRTKMAEMLAAVKRRME